jgi:hypothetical protein
LKIEISGDDAACLDDAKLAGVTFEVVAGDQPLEFALAACRNQRDRKADGGDSAFFKLVHR